MKKVSSLSPASYSNVDVLKPQYIVAQYNHNLRYY